jgi:hypothetical protein
MLVSSAENGLKSAAGYMSSSWISGSFFPPLVSATRDLQHRRRLHSVAEYDIDPGQVLDCVQAFTIPDPASRSPTSLCVPRLFPDLLAKSPQPAILAARRSDIEERLLWDLVDVVWIMCASRLRCQEPLRRGQVSSLQGVRKPLGCCCEGVHEV